MADNLYVSGTGRPQDKRRSKQAAPVPEPTLEGLKTTLRSVETAHKNLDSLLVLLKLLRRDLETVASNADLVTCTNQKATTILKPQQKGIGKR